MRAAHASKREAAAWFVEASPGDPPPRLLRPLRDDYGATSTRAVIVSSLFLVLLASALLIGGHAALDPLLQSAIEARAAKGIGAVVYPMPDGIYCRHVSFDNTTAEIAETAIEHCPEDIVGQRIRGTRGFAWSH